jgi:pimeloyl-ACP methyl ester carboxylesterase
VSMSTMKFLPGIVQHTVKTERLTVAYLEAGSGSTPLVLVHGNASSSLFFQDLMLDLAFQARYKIYAVDMCGYGDSETLPVDATRGMRDYADDLDAFVLAMHLTPFHLFGWSLGGNVVMQYAIDHPGLLRSLTLQSPGSPFGFGGTKGAEGTPTWPDYAGSGGGTANPDFVQRIERGDRESDQNSPRTVMNMFYFKPPFRALPDREEMYLSSILSTKVTPGNYPGDMTPSSNWPNVAPGVQGVNNALAPKYMNQGNFATIAIKPPVLWIHGVDDQIVSDTSLLEFGYLGQLGFVPGWPGEELYPPQPMKTQVRTVLDAYRANGGFYQEAALTDCGHSPHIEKPAEVLKLFTEFVLR